VSREQNYLSGDLIAVFLVRDTIDCTVVRRDVNLGTMPQGIPDAAARFRA
jgi:hypothetical protein